jgi:hypothetical protein
MWKSQRILILKEVRGAVSKDALYSIPDPSRSGYAFT